MKKKFILGCFFSLIALSLFAQSNVNSVVTMEKGTDGSAGTNGQYVLFGVWPQSKKADSIKIDNSKSEKINGWVCYKGSDNSYYVKVTSKPYDDYKFNDGSVIESGKDYYFRLDPIKWRVVDNNYQDGKLLVSEYILCSGSFSAADKDRKINGQKINLNNYEKSSVPTAPCPTTPRTFSRLPAKSATRSSLRQPAVAAVAACALYVPKPRFLRPSI